MILFLHFQCFKLQFLFVVFANPAVMCYDCDMKRYTVTTTSKYDILIASGTIDTVYQQDQDLMEKIRNYMKEN